MMNFFNSRAATSDSKAKLISKVLALACLTLVSGIVVVYAVHSYRYVTPEWVALRETRSRDEFYLKNLSNQLEFTNEEDKKAIQMMKNALRKVPVIENDRDEMEPMWSCKDPNVLQGREKKFVFVHVYRTTGSAIQALLQEYAQMCHAGIASIYLCTWVSFRSLEGGDWQNGHGEHKEKCQMRRAASRDGTKFEDMPHVSTSFLEQNVDILAGHLPIGSSHRWKDGAGNDVDVQYMTFVRDPIHKYVSGVPRLTLNETVAAIKRTVCEAVNDGLYLDQYSTSFITPFQRAVFDMHGFTPTHDEKTNVAIKNLAHFKVIIGITERMSESLEMIQSVLDKDKVLDDLFENFGREDAEVNVNEKRATQSRLSTVSIVEELEKDANFMSTMREYVKYEEKIRQFALAMHLRQYESIRSRKRKLGIAYDDVTSK
jgi:hypothetical protein